MDAKDTIISENMPFLILKCEKKEIFDPNHLGISPIWSDDINFGYSCIYEIKEYQLYLKNLILTSDRVYPIIGGVEPKLLSSENGVETVEYDEIMVPVKFTGAVIIGGTFLKSYGAEDEMPCYSYKTVRELIFQEGKVVTSIDHSKAMLRIRKNLDLGLRDLNKKRDVNCIRHFLKSSFVGDYENPDNQSKTSLKKKLELSPYLQKIKSYYSRIKEF